MPALDAEPSSKDFKLEMDVIKSPTTANQENVPAHRKFGSKPTVGGSNSKYGHDSHRMSAFTSDSIKLTTPHQTVSADEAAGTPRLENIGERSGTTSNDGKGHEIELERHRLNVDSQDVVYKPVRNPDGSIGQLAPTMSVTGETTTKHAQFADADDSHYSSVAPGSTN